MQQFIEFFGNHTILFAGLAVALALVAANEVHGVLTGGKKLSTTEAVRMINDRDPLILDLRPVADFKKGHLLNAVNVPLAKIEERASEFKDRARPVLVYCALGGTSGEAAAKLRKLGFTETYPLRGGLNAWIQGSLPVTVK
jgi:rhodanese-related sulfurtransferase